MKSIGIDLGTTNSVIAHVTGGRAVPIPIGGSPIVPSVVLFEDGRSVVGQEARNLELLHPERTIRSAKRKMGTSARYPMGATEKTPEEVSAEILAALRAGAAKALGEDVGAAVITVPAYFNDAQRRATYRAAEMAGIQPLRLRDDARKLRTALIARFSGQAEPLARAWLRLLERAPGRNAHARHIAAALLACAQQGPVASPKVQWAIERARRLLKVARS